MSEFDALVVSDVQVSTMVGWQPHLSSVVKVTIDVYDEDFPESSSYAMTARDAEVLGIALLNTAGKLREEPPRGQAFYKTIEASHRPVLLPWLKQAAEGIAVMDTTVRPHSTPLYVVEVNNGLGGPHGMGSYVAWCNDPQAAELVGAGLWALLRGSR